MRRLRRSISRFSTLALIVFGIGQGVFLEHAAHVHHADGAHGQEIDVAPAGAPHGPQCRNAEATGARVWDIPDAGAATEQPCALARISRDRVVVVAAPAFSTSAVLPAPRLAAVSERPSVGRLALYRLAPKHSPPCA